MSRKEEIQEKAKSLYYHFCVRETCEGEDDCTNCPYGKVIEPLVSMAKWADQNPREGLWDGNKVLAWISQNIESYCKLNTKNFNNLLFDLRKAMED